MGDSKGSKKVARSIGFIGAGQMAEALARGFVSKNVASADNMFCFDPSEERKQVFKEFGVTPCTDSKEVVSKGRLIFIAVKPQYVKTVLEEVKAQLSDEHVIVSIAAGVPLSVLEAAAGSNAHLIRVMPNTPCLVGESASAMCLGGKANEKDGEDVHTLFAAVGKIFKVDEKLLSAVTGLSGSGPAYIFVAIEALSDGGVKAGLPRDIAQQLAAQTVLGAAKMVLETGRHPGVLKDMVTSPAGTTIAGVYELEKAGLRQAFITAVCAATNRADEFAKL
jgi:pyrroline-5-carboxylate reductase